MRYQSDDVTVDDTFARVGSKSYAINKINSVDVRSKKKPGKWSWAVWWFLAFVIGMPGIIQFAQGDPGNGIGSLLVTGLFGFLGWRSYQKRHPTFSYELFLMTSSNEVQAFTTDSKDEVLKLRGAIEDAMAAA